MLPMTLRRMPGLRRCKMLQNRGVTILVALSNGSFELGVELEAQPTLLDTQKHLEPIDCLHRCEYTVHMPEIQFEWDPAKSRSNKRKHGVSFEEAQTVFLDENAIRFYDPDHSEDEDRFILLGLSIRIRVLVVCHCYRVNDTVIRIISARRADKTEAEDYWR
jgi:uncharacterized protein